MLSASAELGRKLAVRLDPEKPAEHVTTGGLRAEIKALAVPSRAGGGDFSGDDFALTAGWGSTQRGGIVMPGKGRVEARDYAPEEVQALAAGAAPLGLTTARMHDLLGETTFDVYLNDTAYWANVPAKVWDYKLGGYQVVKKWLSYREQDILGRALRPEEVQEVANMVRRIAAILLLSPALDGNYQAVRTVAE